MAIESRICWNEETARLVRSHGDANMISIGQRLVDEQEVTKIVSAWLDAKFAGGRYTPRIRKMDAAY